MEWPSIRAVDSNETIMQENWIKKMQKMCVQAARVSLSVEF